jgi:succinyl-CoA synthetase beta subunit
VDLLEHQGKEFFASFGLPTSPGEVAFSPAEAVAAAERIGYPVVVKAQVHTGGRGKAGGIRLGADADEVRRHAEAILGLDIGGHIVGRLWIEKAADIAEEYYAGFTLDRSARRHLGMLSARGGVDIEEVAATAPGAIARIGIDPAEGLSDEACRRWVAEANLNPAVTEQAVELLALLYRAYVDGDADLVEINPLIVTGDGRLAVLDAKVTLDGNALFRHQDYAAYDATVERDEREQEAHTRGLQYVGLDGTVGVIANGAGLAMATVDIVDEAGGSPANFLDIGGGANADVMSAALEVVDGDPAVRAIFINIFGGITKGEEVARGIIEALGRVDIASPIILRLDGTNAAEGREMLQPHLSDSLRLAPDMVEAARMAVTAASAGTGESRAGADGSAAAAESECCPEPTCCEEPGS